MTTPRTGRPNGRPKKTPLLVVPCELGFDEIVEAVTCIGIEDIVWRRKRREAEGAIMEWPGLTPTAKLVGKFLVWHINRDVGFDFHPFRKIAEDARVKRGLETVKEAFEQLVAAGIARRQCDDRKRWRTTLPVLVNGSGKQGYKNAGRTGGKSPVGRGGKPGHRPTYHPPRRGCKPGFSPPTTGGKTPPALLNQWVTDPLNNKRLNNVVASETLGAEAPASARGAADEKSEADLSREIPRLLGKDIWAAWFADKPAELANGVVTVWAPTTWQRDHVEQRYIRALERICLKVLGKPARVEVCVPPKTKI